MPLSRWRRIATGIAAGVIVLCAALLGASFRSDTSGISVASELRPTVIIPIEEDPVDDSSTDVDSVASDTVDEEPVDEEPVDESAAEDTVAEEDASDAVETPATDDATEADDEALTESVTVIETDDIPDEDTEQATADEAEAPAEAPTDQEPTAEEQAPAPVAQPTAPAVEPAPVAQPATPAAPLPSNNGGLGTGGGVDDAECGLDRLVIYAGARVGGVAGRLRAALNQAGFAAGCPAPVTVLASNCPLQFSGVLGAGSGYDPSKSFVASSANVDRDTMTAIMGTVGFTGSQIDILDFGFVNPDRPGEQWVAIFIPPSFTGWENLANRAGLPISSQSLCAPSGRLAG